MKKYKISFRYKMDKKKERKKEKKIGSHIKSTFQLIISCIFKVYLAIFQH